MYKALGSLSRITQKPVWWCIPVTMPLRRKRGRRIKKGNLHSEFEARLGCTKVSQKAKGKKRKREIGTGD